LRSTDHI